MYKDLAPSHVHGKFLYDVIYDVTICNMQHREVGGGGGGGGGGGARRKSHPLAAITARSSNSGGVKSDNSGTNMLKM